MNLVDRWHLRAVTNIFKEKSGKPFSRNVEDFFSTKPVSDEKKLDGYATLPLIKAVVNLIALITHGQGFSVKSDTLQENNDTLLKTTVTQFMMADRQISLTSKIDILIEWDDSKGVAVLTPIPLEHVKARPDHINDSYVLEWNLETMIVSENGETVEEIKVMRQIYNKKEITTYADGEILPEYSYPNTLGIQRIVTIHIQDLAGQDDPLIGVLEYNISTLYKQALNALGVVVKLTGEPDKYATGAYKVPKEGITNEDNEDGTGNTISVPQFIFDDPKATYGWTEPPKGIPEIISFLEILFWLFLEQTGTPEGTLSTVTGMNSTANQLQVFIRLEEARQNAQTEGIKEILSVLEAVNNLNSRDKVELSGDIEWPEAFPDTTTIKEIIISLMQDTGMSDETKLELIKKRYLDDLPEWEIEKKRIEEQKKSEFEAEVNAHHDESDTITDDNTDTTGD
ncbi:hypothetical protein KAR91_34880 [Candidatus Pacearchaeota archaeon]|nr:hypothetical protein [Candidatus Pacearchaeota archaeon]